MIDTRQEAFYGVSERSALPQAKEGKPTKRKFEILQVKKNILPIGYEITSIGSSSSGGLCHKENKTTPATLEVH